MPTFAARAAEALPKGFGDPRGIIEVLVALFVAKDRAEISGEALASEVARAAQEEIDAGTDWKPLERGLARLLEADHSLGVTAKALGVMADHSKVFRGARILTDIRAIFGADPAAAPVASTIVHKLKIEFNEDDRRAAFVVALDSNDLRALERVLDRAKKKERALRAFLERSHLEYLDAEDLET